MELEEDGEVAGGEEVTERRTFQGRRVTLGDSADGGTMGGGEVQNGGRKARRKGRGFDAGKDDAADRYEGRGGIFERLGDPRATDIEAGPLKCKTISNWQSTRAIQCLPDFLTFQTFYNLGW